MTPLELLHSRLRGVRTTKNGFDAICPAHDDTNPSLSISEGNDGRALLHCHRGCTPEQVLSALNLESKDLFLSSSRDRTSLSEVWAYQYTDEQGTLLYECVRYEPKTFRFRRTGEDAKQVYNLNGVRLVLYRLPELVEAIRHDEPVFIVEGEKDVDTIKDVWGFTATCNPMGAGKWRDTFSDSLKGATCIILPDNDDAGRRHAEQVAGSLQGKAQSVKVISLPNLNERGDVSDWIQRGNDVEELKRLVELAPEYSSAHVSHCINEESRFELLTAKEILAMDIPKPSFLVENLISEESVNLLCGEEGCGKSMLAMNLALAIAAGKDAWLNYRLPRSGVVLYLNNELSFNDFAGRLKQMSEPLDGEALSRLKIVREVPSIDSCWDELKKACAANNPSLVVLDCLYYAHDSNENDSSEMKKLMRQFIELRNRFRFALLLIHHTKKGARGQHMNNELIRGSSVFAGITDTVLQMRRSETSEMKRIIKPTKMRHVSDAHRKCRMLSFDERTCWFRDEGVVDENAHIARKDEPTASEQIDFDEIFGDSAEMSLAKIKDACNGFGYSEKTIQRCVRSSPQLEKASHGIYRLKQRDNGTLP